MLHRGKARQYWPVDLIRMLRRQDLLMAGTAGEPQFYGREAESMKQVPGRIVRPTMPPV